MKKFLKLAVIPMAFLVLGSATSCTVKQREIALISDIGDIDDGSFNQESWEAIKEYATEHNKSYDFYRPFNDSDFARSCAIKQAVAKGAKLIILPGFKFAPTCAAQHSKYPDVHFLLIDSTIDRSAEHPAKNVCCVGFKCAYSGFSAGYTVATDLMMRDWEDNNKLNSTYGYGYCGGMANNGVLEFGFGFTQGVIRATADFCNPVIHPTAVQPKININYNYAQVFAQDDNVTARLKGWLNAPGQEIKVLFPCGGKLYQSTTEAVQYYNKHQIENYDDWLKGKVKVAPRKAARWIGVDSDQYRGLSYEYEKKSIYTSALKGLKKAIGHTLEYHYNNEWDRIGGYRAPNPEPEEGEGEIGENGQWMLGMHSLFGDYKGMPMPRPEDYDDFVGIPVEDYNHKTGVIRGFEKYTISQCEELRNRLIVEDGNRIEVYEKDGVELKKEKGNPTDMPNWILEDGTKFNVRYMGSYPSDKIFINYI